MDTSKIMVTTGYNGTIRTWDGFLTWLDQQGIEPELKRRTIAICYASHVAGRPLSVGSAKRGKVAADNGFKSRYYVIPSYQPGAVLFEGKYWKLRAGQSPMMPSDRTYHVRMTPKSNADPDADGLYCLAIDFIGDLKFLAENQVAYGFEEFKDENGEPWHGQAREIPKARKNYQYGNKLYDPLPMWQLPGNPTPKPVRVFAAKATQRQRAKVNDGANVPAEVRSIQLFCNFWKFTDAMGRNLVVDGDYGSKTDQAVRRLQEKLGLYVDGIWGPRTEAVVQGFLDYMVSR